jgi:hypothetical protein
MPPGHRQELAPMAQGLRNVFEVNRHSGRNQTSPPPYNYPHILITCAGRKAPAIVTICRLKGTEEVGTGVVLVWGGGVLFEFCSGQGTIPTE